MFLLTPAARQSAATLLLGLLARLAHSQAPAGDGLRAEYYADEHLTQLVLVRREATIDANWGHGAPVPGVAAENFSVRWTGWLLPPVSGRYLLHATVDDGMRIWLNDRLVLDEWRLQPISNYTVAVELKAGTPYRLRVEYFQNIFDTRARLTWERPDQRKSAPPPASWRNLWGMVAADDTGPEPIPGRYLFTQPPPGAVRARAATPAAAGPRPAPTVARPAAMRQPVAAGRTTALPSRTTPAAPVRTPPAVVARTVAPSPAPDSTAQRTARLATGEALTLPDLRFEQGRAQLLPAARRTLDGLLPLLRQRPSLRLEIQGHTDNVGDAILNRQLSQRRAEAVRDYLVDQGVPTARLQAVGYGGSQPVANNADPAQRPRNRRVVLRRL